jgi:hypothetical protein
MVTGLEITFHDWYQCCISPLYILTNTSVNSASQITNKKFGFETFLAAQLLLSILLQGENILCKTSSAPRSAVLLGDGVKRRSKKHILMKCVNESCSNERTGPADRSR